MIIRKLCKKINSDMADKNSRRTFQIIMNLASLTLALVVLLSCKGEHDHSSHMGDHAAHSAESSLMPATDATRGSLYEFQRKLVRSDGSSFAFSDMKGKVFLISMFYASCQSVCPRITADLKRLSQSIRKEKGKDVQIVLVSFDSENDKPNVLAEYKRKQNLNQDWTLLSGDADTVRSLSVLLGINYKKIPDGNFNHSALISLVSPEGIIVSRIEGIGKNATPLLQVIDEL
ncbi:MAG: SCO family protein [Leptospiraceae bacterium]|nr:SCO family protein [Leptospiraceae bacterium]